jgi:hypothetical protein
LEKMLGSTTPIYPGVPPIFGCQILKVRERRRDALLATAASFAVSSMLPSTCQCRRRDLAVGARGDGEVIFAILK